MIKRFWRIAKEKTCTLYKAGVFHVLVGSFIAKFVAFFGSTILSRLFTKTEYGIIGYVENLFSYAILFAGLGLTNAMFRYVVKADTIEEKNAYYGYVIKRSTLYNIVITVIAGLVFTFLYPHKPSFAAAKYLLPILILSLPFHSLFDSNLACYRSLFDNKHYAIYSCAVSIGLMLLKAGFSVMFQLNGVFFAHILVYGIATALMMYNIKKRYFNTIHKPIQLSKQKKRETDGYSLQYMITNGVWTLFMLNDVFLLGRITGDSTVVADYKIAYVLPACLALLSAAISIFVTPYFVRNENDYAWVRKRYMQTLLATCCFVGIAAVVMAIAAKPLLTFFYSAKYASVAPLMRVLVLAAFVNTALRSVAANILAATGRIMVNMVVSICGILLQLTANIILIPRFGSIGVAWVSVAIYMVMAVAVTVAMFVCFSKRAESRRK